MDHEEDFSSMAGLVTAILIGLAELDEVREESG